MGTQQILLIVLSVIIVGVAIAVGITMFSNQAYNSNQQAVSSELQNYAAQVAQYYKVPKGMGGAGQDSSFVTVASVANFIGFKGADYSTTTDNGEFRVISTAGNTVTLKGLGKEKKGTNYPLVTSTIDIPACNISTTVSSGPGF